MIPNRRKQKKVHNIELDEIFLDSSNLPSFDQGRLEGRLELPISGRSIVGVGVVFALIVLVFAGQLFKLQIVNGSAYREQSESNRLDQALLIAERGVIYDRNGELLAWNEHNEEDNFPGRAYTDRRGMGPLIGYVSYPQRDAAGFYYRTEYLGRTGVEETMNTLLAGTNGEQLVEIGAVGDVISEHVVHLPEAGESITLSIDAELSEIMHDILASTTAERGFRSGAGAIMDVHTGEIIASASFPTFDPEVMADGSDTEKIDEWNNDNRFPFLNKVVGGLYTPGSIVKPFMAYAALAENIIDPLKTIVSTGAIIVPNRYDPDNPARFADWRAHGKMDMRRAIAVSSNVYFYYVGGGYADQEGIGITKINKYMDLFGFGSPTGIDLSGEAVGTVPNPEWKTEIFDDDWRLGDTYLTSIGQFGFQVTPLQMLRAYAAIANGGKLVTPHIVQGGQGDVVEIDLDMDALQVVREGMRQAAEPGGTAQSIIRNDVTFAAKTGTAEVGASKAFVNTWVTGYFPYEEPKYTFILLMEHGPRENLFGAAPTMAGVFSWMAEHRSEYLGITPPETVE